MTAGTLHLTFGYDQALIPGLRAAWGARLIVTQDGGVDLVPDRQDYAGDPALFDELRGWLQDRWPKAAEAISIALRHGDVSTRQAATHILYWPLDHSGAIVGNTNASAGYLYVAAWLTGHLPEGHRTYGMERAIGLRAAERAGEPR